MPQQPNLQRFLDAQQRDYATALAEIRAGRKRSHWMWYIFPQIQGLGYSETARFYAIQNRQEAEAYLQHPVLGPRLVEISEALLALESNDATRIMGSPDDMKLRSSMTLFGALAGANPVFQRVLDKLFEGEQDQKTLQILRQNL
ncbi:DUF1810 domain-containing protein [Hymenobacter lutimineralis]|uniref:DUF1810 domain-containing protein n=1 Tax=Hymenobacter lutimineralis TaxID=2606448 RepID=A0A5D6UQF9_9BACT|nr:DUF1810 domain-containing protein [Hymenobacter lutimineralis]TYZ05891.1 DUF1810 domain-containing protein [Hymenobacter lutimineralis]